MNTQINKETSCFKYIKTATAYHKLIKNETGKITDFEFVEVNEAFKNLLDSNSKKIHGIKYSEVTRKRKEADIDIIKYYGEIALKGKESSSEFYSNLHKKWFKVSIYYPTNRYFVAEFQDITDYKKKAKGLENKEIMLLEALKITAHDIFVADVIEEGKYCLAYVNREEEIIKEFKHNSTIIGKDMDEIFPPDILKNVYLNYNRCIKAEAPISFEENVVLEKEVRWWFTTLVPLKNEFGRIYRLVGSSLEISERKRFEEELNRYRDHLEELVKERTHKLEQEQIERKNVENTLIELKNQALSASMNPHFIFNSLNSIQDYMNNHGKEEANEYLVNFARLIRMNLELAGKTFIPLREELIRLELYLKYEMMRFPNRLSYAIEYCNGFRENEYEIPNMILQPFVENAIWHGILNKSGAGQIKIEFCKSEIKINKERKSAVKITITDDGIGLEESKKYRKAKHVSKGTEIIKERLKLLEEEVKDFEFVKIEEMGDGKQGVRVTILLTEKHYRIRNL